MTEPKCFALEGKTCQILTGLKPQCGNCPFYRTGAELVESCRVANMRLAGLSKDLQSYVSTKYYNGEMPWEER